MIECNGVQTQVITEGRWIEEGLSTTGTKHVVIVIPGNPGVPGFYARFIKILNTKLPPEMPIWIVGHAGHVQPPNNLAFALPSHKSWDQYYGLRAQLEHKKEFIKKYVPEDAKLHIVGHSIGSWFALNLLRDEEIAKKVVKCYMLFPTIEYMAETKNGRFFTNVVARLASLLIFLAWIFSFFPLFLQDLLIRAFGLFYGISSRSTKAVTQFLNPYVVKRVILLAKEEMKYVRERDDQIISTHLDKFWFYYGASDGWAPVKYYENIKEKHPNLEAQVCKRGFYHSFVLQHDEEMGKILGDLINENLTKA